MSATNERLAQLEAVLFVASKPLTLKVIAEVLHCTREEVGEAVEALKALYHEQQRGIQILEQGGSIQMASHPRFGQLVGALYREELSGELTRPSLETLTIIAYRGPIRKSELDQIRGVNCALILRNLLLRGLIETTDEQSNQERMYTITMDCLRHLGISRVEELPDFAELHSHEKIVSLLEHAV